MAFDLVVDLRETNQLLSRLCTILEKLATVAERAFPDIPDETVTLRPPSAEMHINDNDAAFDREQEELRKRLEGLSEEELHFLFQRDDF